MDWRTLQGYLVKILIIFSFLFAAIVAPIYATTLIFTHGLWVAKVLVYIACALAMIYGIKDYKVDRAVAKWYLRKFGTKII